MTSKGVPLSFRDEAKAASKHVIRVHCLVQTILDKIPADERDEVAEAIDDLELTGTAIARTILNRYGLTISHHVINRHRRRLYGNGCRCE